MTRDHLAVVAQVGVGQDRLFLYFHHIPFIPTDVATEVAVGKECIFS